MSTNTRPLFVNVVAIATLALSGCASASKDKAVKLAAQDVPQNVMGSVKNRLPGASVTSVEKEKEHGAIVYDFELSDGGRKYEMDVKEDGTILEIEKQVTLNNTPKAVIDAVHAKYPAAEIKQVMEVDKVKGKEETPMHYEIDLVTSGKTKEVVVALDGSSVKEEEEGD